MSGFDKNDMATPGPSESSTDLSLEQLRRIDQACDRFEAALAAGLQPSIEQYLSELADLPRSPALHHLLELEIQFLLRQGQAIDVEGYHRRFTDDATVVAILMRDAGVSNELRDSWEDSTWSRSVDLKSTDARGGPVTARTSSSAAEMPGRIGRFRIAQLLGEGGFGRVYRAYDPQLDRQVALKVPRPGLFTSDDRIQLFLQEARSAGKLNHPALVTVHDVQTLNGQPYIVQEFVDGCDLGKWVEEQRPSYKEKVSVLLDVVDAMSFVHEKQLYHRDLKPANILVDREGHAHVADFGLAVHVSALRQRRGEIAGSPAYMSPEQVRGETHRIDGRTDIWSIGVVFYQLLTDKQPFRGETRDELFANIQNQDPPSPREHMPDVPSELERICLRCLAKLSSDRYATGAELGKELRDALTLLDEADRLGRGEQAELPIVPRGLRSFEPRDAEFFVQLLPGPRDRTGLPESIRFWTCRIEELDPLKTFRVGLIFGPSGCGKSSFVRAGILPRLHAHVVPCYVEATPYDTEVRLLKSLRRQIPHLPTDESLPEILKRIREQRLIGRKLLLVIDQFEQWLHGRMDLESSQLLHALRQCDGGAVQAVFLIRDDFWMPVTRCMRELELPIDASNSQPVDLFPPRHAQAVLVRYGRAYDQLPAGTLSQDQQLFVEQAVSQLAEDGTVICVRLALFALMMKDKPWTTAALKAIGGIEGVGITYLEETLGPASTLVRAGLGEPAGLVLEALLPDPGTNLKGAMRSRDDLMRLTSLAQRAADFDRLMKTLDTDLRLVTPTDPEGIRNADDGSEGTSSYFQLTHDFLVPQLREWFNRRRKETIRGRAELQLVERAVLWKDRRERRHLPSWWEYANIALLTNRRGWNDVQRQMMRQAGRYYFRCTAWGACLLILAAWGSYEANGRLRADALTDSLLTAQTNEITPIIRRLRDYRRWTTPKLERLLSADPTNETERKKQLHARMALAAADETQIPRLHDALLAAEPDYLAPILDALAPHRRQVLPQLWQLFQDPAHPAAIRFRAGLALATFDATSKKWAQPSRHFLARQLISANPDDQRTLRALMVQVAEQLVDPLTELFQDARLQEGQLVGAANALVDFTHRDPEKLAILLCQALPAQYDALSGLFEQNKSDEALQLLVAQAAEQPADGLPSADRVALGRRRANAAITLLRNGNTTDALNVLRVSNDPESLTQFVQRGRALDVTASQLVAAAETVNAKRQQLEGDLRTQEDVALCGLLQTLGQYKTSALAAPERDRLVRWLTDWYRQDPSSVVHSTSGWLLRRWGLANVCDEADRSEVSYSPGRQWFTLRIPTDATEFHLTFVVFPAGTYTIGDREPVPNQKPDEALREVRISRPFAVLDREITFSEYSAFDPSIQPFMGVLKSNPPATLEDTALLVPWYNAVKFCRWLTEARNVTSGQAYDAPETLDGEAFPRETNRGYENLPRAWPVRLDRPGFRLPTAAEWEIACRAGTETTFSFGSDVTLAYGYGYFASNTKRFQPPKQLLPNLAGIFDMHGNAFEWCHDWTWDPSVADTYDPAEDLVDPLGPAVSTGRIVRGGAWRFDEATGAAARRKREEPHKRSDTYGFRLVLTLETN